MSVNLIDKIVNSDMRGIRKRENKIFLYNTMKEFVKTHGESKDIKNLMNRLKTQLVNYSDLLES